LGADSQGEAIAEMGKVRHRPTEKFKQKGAQNTCSFYEAGITLKPKVDKYIFKKKTIHQFL
jgi:hypothetical protein